MTSLEENNQRFAFWARFYDLTWVPLFWLRKKSLDFIETEEGDNVLDIACGTGQLTRRLRGEVLGVDGSLEMIKIAQDKGGNFEVQDATNLNFEDKSFDKVVISMALHEMPIEDAKKALTEAKRVLRDKGVLYIIDFSKGQGIVYKLGNLFVQLIEEENYRNFLDFEMPQEIKKEKELVSGLISFYKYQKI